METSHPEKDKMATTATTAMSSFAKFYTKYAKSSAKMNVRRDEDCQKTADEVCAFHALLEKYVQTTTGGDDISPEQEEQATVDYLVHSVFWKTLWHAHNNEGTILCEAIAVCPIAPEQVPKTIHTIFNGLRKNQEVALPYAEWGSHVSTICDSFNRGVMEPFRKMLESHQDNHHLKAFIGKMDEFILETKQQAMSREMIYSIDPFLIVSVDHICAYGTKQGVTGNYFFSEWVTETTSATSPKTPKTQMQEILGKVIPMLIESIENPIITDETIDHTEEFIMLLHVAVKKLSTRGGGDEAKNLKDRAIKFLTEDKTAANISMDQAKTWCTERYALLYAPAAQLIDELIQSIVQGIPSIINSSCRTSESCTYIHKAPKKHESKDPWDGITSPSWISDEENPKEGDDDYDDAHEMEEVEAAEEEEAAAEEANAEKAVEQARKGRRGKPIEPAPATTEKPRRRSAPPKRDPPASASADTEKPRRRRRRVTEVESEEDEAHPESRDGGVSKKTKRAPTSEANPPEPAPSALKRNDVSKHRGSRKGRVSTANDSEGVDYTDLIGFNPLDLDQDNEIFRHHTSQKAIHLRFATTRSFLIEVPRRFDADSVKALRTSLGTFQKEFGEMDLERVNVWVFLHSLLKVVEKEIPENVSTLIFGEGNFTALIAAFIILTEEKVPGLRLEEPNVISGTITRAVESYTIDNESFIDGLKSLTVENIERIRGSVTSVPCVV